MPSPKPVENVLYENKVDQTILLEDVEMIPDEK